MKLRKSNYLDRSFLTSTEVAEVCGVNRATVVRWIQAGGLKAETTLGGRYRINIDSLLEQANAGGIFIAPEKRKKLSEAISPKSSLEPVTAAHKEASNIQILLIDDDADIRSMLSEFFSLMGYSVLSADNGFKALDFLMKNYNVKLIILDLLMPGINGIETLEKIRELRSNVSIIVTSGFIDYYYPNGIAPLKGNVDAVLKKPFDLDELSVICRRLLKSS